MQHAANTDLPGPAPGLTRESRSRNPEQTQLEILEIATLAFAEKGLSGARVDDIAARTRTTKRMIYYYFGSKEGLYSAVIERAYGGIRDAERQLQLDSLPAVDAMRRLVESTFDYHQSNPAFVRLVSVENIEEGRHVRASAAVAQRNAEVVVTMRNLLERGAREGSFRGGVDPLDLHILINGVSFHRVSNRHTLHAIFGRDLREERVARSQREMLVEAVLAFLRPR
ncbi:TetR family transcriptional regulator [Roseomonas sp. SSH11]|uniref:TetR family transcriptional regulator n=2 Tax=Pararoseomonas baculiformis TaxID=2820812 RepID=A0ABS4AL12_9PROT|nr:TetR family transcriptional regulator [Pararoseomonas baculiformis]